MNYIELNKEQKLSMRGICQNTEEFDWEDQHILNVLAGDLSKLRMHSENREVQVLMHEIEKLYETYSFFNTDKDLFISNIDLLVEKIRAIDPFWMGIYVSSIKEEMDLQKACLIYGEGGIGKSYFIKCLEDELDRRRTKHLCVYGKFLKNLDIIDFESIEKIGTTEEFVFAFDAINEISREWQIELAQKIERLKEIKGVRIIVTYRLNDISQEILSEYEKIIKGKYKFPGVSFESVLEWLQKEPITDINEYVDLLYLNNPFLLSKLPLILKDKKEKNNISRQTYIYEQYIKRALSREIWGQTKKVVDFLYKNNTKSFSVQEIKGVLEDPRTYIEKMQQYGFLSGYFYGGNQYYHFTIESLADYLLARQLFDEIDKKTIEDCIQIIVEKIKSFSGLNRESVIVMLFDKFAPDFLRIKKILFQTDLIEDFTYDLLVKIHFEKQDIPAFLESFRTSDSEDLLLFFAGFLDKPFNCTNYLNKYYLSDIQKHTQELSKKLEGKHFLGELKGRLKNILYFTIKCSNTQERAFENFYTAIWCTASCNPEIRQLAKKLLYEVVQRNPILIDEAIGLFDKIEDAYIKDAIIHALSSCEMNPRIEVFFREILKDKEFTLAKSIRRICGYLKEDYCYIDCFKRDLIDKSVEKPSKEFIDIIHWIDLFEQHLLPFRVFGTGHIENSLKFLSTDKNAIKEFNQKLVEDFNCVEKGNCCGSMIFEERAMEYYNVAYNKATFNSDIILSSFERIVRDVFIKYGLPFEHKYTSNDFTSSRLRKCICIATDIFIGGLMCNYYSNDFETFNDITNSIGYKVYDPLRYEEEINLCSPIAVYQPKVEKMGNIVLKQINLPGSFDTAWWKDLEISKNNLLNILKPIKFNGQEWILMAGRIALHNNPKDKAWQDVYIIRTCISDKENLKGDGDDRYLTIELDKYHQNLMEYSDCENKSWLCKDVPTIAYNSGIFEDSILVLPPAEMVKDLGLTCNLLDMTWRNSNDEAIIYCNNNKASYYNDFISGTVFIRKDVYEILRKQKTIKFFAYAEKMIENRGFCDETAYHYEIQDGKITRMFPNYTNERSRCDFNENGECENCKYGFWVDRGKPSELQVKIDEILAKYSG